MASWPTTEVVMNKQVRSITSGDTTNEWLQGGRVFIKVELRQKRGASVGGVGGLNHVTLSAYVGHRIHANGELFSQAARLK
jgi:hypothetical protein